MNQGRNQKEIFKKYLETNENGNNIPQLTECSKSSSKMEVLQ